MSAMAREIAILLAEREINALIQRYCHCMDLGDEAGWVGCFTETALFDVRHRNGDVVHIENGRAELARYIAGYPKPPEMRRHLYSATLLDVDVEAGRASGESYWTLLASGPGGAGLVLAAFGRASDRFVRGADGWRIERRLAVAEAMA